MFIIIVLLGIVVLSLCAQGRLLSKAGENGWKILIPVYGSYLLYKVSDAVGIFAANMAIAFLNLVIAFFAGEVPALSYLLSIGTLLLYIFFCIRLAKAYGKNGGFAVGLIFLPLIFQCILGFGDARHEMYNALQHADRNAGHETKESWRCPACGAVQPASRLYCRECSEKRPEKSAEKA